MNTDDRQRITTFTLCVIFHQVAEDLHAPLFFTVTFSTFCRRKLCKIWYCLPFADILTCYGFCIYQFLWACFIDYGSRSCPQCPREKGFCCGNSLTGTICPKASCPSPLPTSLPIFSNNFLLWSRLNPSSLILKDQVANASSMSSSFGRGPELRSVRNNSWAYLWNQILPEKITFSGIQNLAREKNLELSGITSSSSFVSQASNLSLWLMWQHL